MCIIGCLLLVRSVNVYSIFCAACMLCATELLVVVVDDQSGGRILAGSPPESVHEGGSRMAMLDLESPPSGGPWTFGVAALDGGAALGVAALVGLRRELKINLCPGQGHSLSATRRERWEAGGMQEEAGRRRLAAEECLSSHPSVLPMSLFRRDRRR